MTSSACSSLHLRRPCQIRCQMLIENFPLILVLLQSDRALPMIVGGGAPKYIVIAEAATATDPKTLAE